jgi:uncharacterized heparinase superfamily protein
MALGRLLRTVRHLKPEQVWGRAAHLVSLTRPDPRPAPPRRALVGLWAAPAPKPASYHPPASFRFLNQDGEVAGAAGWQSGQALLWLYNLHYFDDLGSAEALADPGARLALIARWTHENPPGVGVGWQPYPTSLRIVNWIKAALAGLPLPDPAIQSLAVQARWLRGHLEHHLLGNHLLANAKALAFAGLWFDGPEADGWLATAIRLLARELPEQILADGGHFERSPMYQAIILEDLLDLLNLARAFGLAERPVIAALPGRIAAMQAWLAAMTHPDGRIAFFNDAAFGIATEPAELEAYADRLGLPAAAAPTRPLTELAASGYVRLQMGPAVALLDVAPIGPDYLPGHAHADTLSFELSVHGQRVVVNGGTSVYGDGPERQAERATRAHSTVEVDGESSSEVWAGFRVGRRARVRDLAIEAGPDAVTVCAAHDGYAWRPGRPIHRRRWRMTPAGLSIEDTIEGHASQAIARFHLAPEVTATADRLSLPRGKAIGWRTSTPARIVPETWSPEFGRRATSHGLEAPLEGGRLLTEFSW